MQTYSIHEVAAKFDLPLSTLRYYETAGLIPGVERNGKNRVYTADNVERIRALLCFKNTGMSIAELQTVFHYEDDEPDLDKLIDLLDTHCEQVEAQLNLLEQNYHHIQSKVNYYKAIREAKQTGGEMPVWDDFL